SSARSDLAAIRKERAKWRDALVVVEAEIQRRSVQAFGEGGEVGRSMTGTAQRLVSAVKTVDKLMRGGADEIAKLAGSRMASM
ncbi:hypothetical protein GN156_35540, partial [bacterium LRH843]|nr:hypothetical protein [bacterium LRH843]